MTRTERAEIREPAKVSASDRTPVPVADGHRTAPDVLVQPSRSEQAGLDVASGGLGQHVSVRDILALQRMAGNQAVRRLRPSGRSRSAEPPQTNVAVQRRVMSHSEWIRLSTVMSSKGVLRGSKPVNRSEKLRAIDESLRNWHDQEGHAQGVAARPDLRMSLLGKLHGSIAAWKADKSGTSQRTAQVETLSDEVERELLPTVKDFEEAVAEDKRNEILAALPDATVSAITATLPRKYVGAPIAEQLTTLPNTARAETALSELKAKQAVKAKNKTRLTDSLIELLVWGVAKSRGTGNLAREGIIGIDQAVGAADALIGMPKASYVDLVLKLVMTGGIGVGNEPKAEGVLILKTVAARKSAYLAEGAEQSKAAKDVGEFARTIRGEDMEKLIEATSLRDIGGGEGLQQRFTMSCGPTSIQIIHGEADPIYALDISKKGKRDLAYESPVAEEQQKIMGTDLIPREVMDGWNAFNATVDGLVIPAADVTKWQALGEYIGGKSFDPALKAQGVALAAALGYPSDRLDEFKKHFPFNEPGLGAAEINEKLAAAVAGGSNRKPKMTTFNPPSRPITAAHLDDVWKALFRGRDVSIGVDKREGGGHVMAFTDAQGTPPTGGPGRQFLLSDPWTGTSEWLTNDQILGGDFGSNRAGDISLTNF